MTRPGAAQGVRSALGRGIRLFALVLMAVADRDIAWAAPQCVGDCGTRSQVTAADIVLMTDIAAGNTDVSACMAGDPSDDGHITADEIDTAIQNLFGGCAEQPASYDVLAGELYHIVYPTRFVSVTQAAAIAAALEAIGSQNEAELRALLSQLLSDSGVQADRIGQIVIYAQRQAADCADCIATCKGRCVQSPRGDCFCYEPLPPDSAGPNTTILLLEKSEDESMALDADRVPCIPALLHAGVNDSFSTTNGTEVALPSQDFLKFIQQGSGQPPANFDGTASDQRFGHTFVLPQGKCVQAAKILFRARPLSINPSPGSRNDSVELGFVNAAGQFVGAHSAAFFGTGNAGLPALLTKLWQPSNYPAPAGASFVLNLANAPGGMNLLPDLDARRFLDFFVQDDTSVDYVSLVFRLCDCPIPTPTPTRTPTHTPTRTRTPTPTPSATPTGTPSPSPTPTICTMTICKQTIPAGGTGFLFNSGALFQNVTLDDGQCASRLTPCGPIYDVFEIPKPGSTLSNIACGFTAGTGTFMILGATVNPTNGFEPGDNDVLFYFQPGTSLQCTFVNIIPTPTVTATPTPTNTILTPTNTATPTLQPTTSATSSPTRTPSPTTSFTGTPTVTRTPSTTVTPTATATATSCVLPPPNLVAWWPLDEPANATTVVDIGLPPPNNGVPQLGPINSSSPGGPLSVPGNLVTTPPDGALLFPVPTTYVEVPPSSDLNLASSDLTIDAWIRPTEVHPVLPGTVEVVEPIVDKLKLSNHTGYALYVQITGTCLTCPPSPHPPPLGTMQDVEMHLVFAVGDGISSTFFYRSNAIYTGTFTVAAPPSPITPPWPGWMHVTVTVDRTTVPAIPAGIFYLNGSSVLPPPPPNPGPVGSFVPVAGMDDNTTSFLIGGTRLFPIPIATHGEIEINELEIFNVPLSPGQIQSIAGSSAGKCKGTSAPTPTATLSPTPPPPATATRTPTPIPTPTATPTRTATRTPTASLTVTPVPSNTPTLTATSSFTRAPSPSLTPTGTATSTRTRTATPTPTPSCITPPSDMVAWWTADNTANDLAGNANHGALHGSAAYTSGMVGAAFSLPTIADFVEVPDSPTLNFLGNFSIDAWILTTNPTTARATVVDKRAGTNTNPVGYSLFIFQGTVGFQLADGQPFFNQVSPGPLINNGTWHHVAATINRGSTTGGNLYVDGQLIYTFDPTTHPGSIVNGANLRLGVRTNGSPQTFENFQGAIDEVELFDRELSLQDVRAIFNAQSGGKCKTPLPSRTSSTTATRTPTRTSTSTPTVSFTATPLPSNTPTPTPTSSSTRTPSPSRTPTGTASLTSTPTATLTRTQTATATPSWTPTRTPTVSPTLTKTPTPIPTQTRTASSTATRTPTSTGTRTPTATSIASFTPTASPTCPGAMCTQTPSRTPTVSPTPCFAEVCVAKFEDQDHDGFHDPGEPNIAGWLIHIADAGANIIATLITGIQGCTGVPGQATYTVSEVLQTGWTQTFPPAPGTHTIFVECGQLLNLEFGNFQNALSTPTATATPSRTLTRTPTRTPNIPPNT